MRVGTVISRPTAEVDPRPPSSLTVGAQSFEVVLPSWRDPRLSLTATIVALQILGQTVLKFNVSIAQILLAIGTAAVVELGLVLWHQRRIIWPASAIQSGNGIGLIMRVPGTVYGDWWSMRGWSLFAGVAAFSIFSKYAIRWGDRHLFNPSNFGLVVAFVALGTTWVDPQDLWWGPLSGPVIAALGVIAFGGVFATYRAKVLRVTLSFYLPFAILLGVLAASGHWMTARWSVEPITDWHYWWIVVTSPEILVFILFMITDPRTVPKGDTARTAFGVTIAVIATLMIAPVHTEFWTKVNILAALVICCALRPAFERWIPSDAPRPLRLLRAQSRSPKLVGVAAGALVLVLVAVVLLGSGVRQLPPGAASVISSQGVGNRPQVEIASNVPVTLGASPDVAGTVDPDLARRAARNVLENLAIEGKALQTSDSSLAETALHGARLAEVGADIASGEAVDVRTITPEHLTVLWVRGSSGPQAPPEMAVTVWGTATTRTFENGAATEMPVVSRFARTFVVVDDGTTFLTESEGPPIGGQDGPAIRLN